LSTNLIAKNNNSDTLSIYFDFGSASLTNKAKHKIRQIANNFSLNELDSVSFIGVADSIGSTQDNMKLSMKRAKNAKKYAKYLFKGITKRIS